MGELFSVHDNLSGTTAGRGVQLGAARGVHLISTQMRTTLGRLLIRKPTSTRYYCLHFAANISASGSLLKRRGKYISESESCDTSDEDKYPPGKGYRVLEPHVVEFPSYAAMEEEKFWSELLAFPWQRGRTERFRRKLEEKYFPKHGLDSMLLPAYRNKNKTTEATASSSSSSSIAGFPDDQVYRKLDYPTIAKALSPGAEGKESFRSQRSLPSSAKKVSSIAVDGESFSFDTSPTIRTIRAPLSVDEGLTTSPTQSCDAEDGEEDINGEDDEEDNVVKDSPTILKCGMVPPEKWGVTDGTVVLIDKPKGWTSFSVCEKIRQLVKVKKVGHAGTLDPMATGLLVVCVGPATKLADKYQALYKVYTGTFRLGEATSSCDAESPVNERKPWEHITDGQIQVAKGAFIGDIMQIPPMYSAIKVDGERLYEKARRGEHLDVPARKITIHDLWIERNMENRQDLDFYVRCSKGTYIRSLCADFARALNSCAHLTSLRREKIGKLSVNDAWTIEDLTVTYRRLYRKPESGL